MRGALKAGVIVVPLLVLFLALRTCTGGAAERWESRIREHDPEARVVTDTEDLIVIASDSDYGRWAGSTASDFRQALIDNYSDLLGRGNDQRMVVVVFSSVDRLQAYAGSDDPLGGSTGRNQTMHGFTRPSKNAVFVPPDITPGTLRHEVVHLLMAESHGSTTRFSPWLSEGLAQLFEPYTPGVSPPGVDRNLAAMVVAEIDVQRLVDLQDYDEFTGRGGARNYVESLLLTGFLFERRPRETLAAYIRKERAFAKGRETEFARLYDYRGDAFRRDFADYVRSLKRG